MNLKINGFLNIPFGENQQKVSEMMREKGGILSLEDSSHNTLIFDNIQFAGYPTTLIAINFLKDEFCRAMIFIKASLESRTIDLYKQIKEEINEKYYQTKVDFENYEYPFKKHDGHTETAITLGKAIFSAYWSFKNDESKEDDYISVKIDENFHIIITYENGQLMKALVDIQKQENHTDY
ncbi:Uncharacterised protein [Chryseobacterium nakagawai]|uniref:Uncharacterized protein n=1 Tax=Chryseobacterium nakagawai TaxID=1241982 RepID=A0AAD1DPN7_CHRNA|nr:hypothetical protein [Chryseobacterium nakagawai]AZA89943.1 hypothetical protein EG343_04540 [Chryseobacterium nakagawai]VEH21362.1 Uncharacterised protein [Chryseobacterium nakagawai]